MRLSVEVYCEKPFFIKEGSYLKTSIRSHGMIYPDTFGEDVYRAGCLVLSGKRIGGIARKMVYKTNLFSAGLARGEARPGAFVNLSEKEVDDVSLILETNFILDPGLVRELLGIRLINGAGKAFDIPLKRPDIEMAWDVRGRYVINITEFVNCKIFAA
jgi:hypothetical protein